MADQTRFRSPTRDPGASQAPSGAAKGRFSSRGEDPLAELARLIGQDDPFADFQDDPRNARSAGNGQAARNGDGRARHEGDFDPRQPARERGHARPQPLEDDRPEPDFGPARRNGRSAYAYGGGPEARQPRAPAERQYEEDPYAQGPAARRTADREADYAHEAESEYDDPRYARDPREADSPYERDQATYAPEYEEERYAGEYYEDEAYAEPASSRRWLYIVGGAAVAALIVVGSGVLGYRALIGKHAGGTPPTIRSADAPTKVAPQAAQTGEGSGQKLIYDRLDGPKPAERLVSREEQPADIAQPQSGSRVVTAPQPTSSITAFAPVPGAQSGAPPAIVAPPPQAMPTPPQQAATEPRRVRTTTVRADGTIVDTPRPAPAAPRAGANQQQPLALNPYAQSGQQDEGNTGAAQPRTAALAPTRASQPAGQQPWGDVVQQPAPLAPAAAPQQVSNYVPAGSYVVQVASQKTEADARTSWQQLQGKYGNVFGNYQATIKRVDLGDRGTFYRAMLGPFANRDQAYEMCQSLKAAGGECIVQRN